MSGDSEAAGFAMFLGIVTGAIIMGILYGCNSTQDRTIISGNEFYLEGAVRQCAVVHKLEDSKKESK